MGLVDCRRCWGQWRVFYCAEATLSTHGRAHWQRYRDRKRMARLILEDVTLNRDQTLISVQVRFKGGATKILSLPTPPRVWQLRKTKRKSSPKSIDYSSNAPTQRLPPNSTKRVGALRPINPSVLGSFCVCAPLTNCHAEPSACAPRGS